MKLILATRNAHKTAEMREILAPWEVLSLAGIGFEGEITEDGATFEENAMIKARAAASAATRLPSAKST